MSAKNQGLAFLINVLAFSLYILYTYGSFKQKDIDKIMSLNKSLTIGLLALLALLPLDAFAEKQIRAKEFVSANQEPAIVPGRLLFKLKDSARLSSEKTLTTQSRIISSNTPTFLRKVSTKTLEPLLPKSQTALSKTSTGRKSRLDNIFKLDLASKNKANFNRALKLCQNDPTVEFCQPSYIYTSDSFPQDAPPNDPKYLIPQIRKYLDYMKFNNQSWSKSMGEDIIVAVIDTPFFSEHQDLQDNIWLNKGEFAPSIDVNGDRRISLDELKTAGLGDTDQNGVIQLKDLFGSSFEDEIDNDGNNKIDDFMGWNFFDSKNDNSRKRSSHGTSVMSVIGAVGNNGKGLIGVASKSQIMMIQVGADTSIGSGRGTESETAGLNYAVANGAKVINYSRGGGSPNDWVTQAAIQDAIDQGVVFVASAGNNNRDVVNNFPAKYSEAIAVGALSTQDAPNFPPSNYGMRLSSSNYGSGIGVWAMGEEIAVAGTISTTSTSISGQTSIATPFVTGAVAMLMSKNIREVPDANSPRRIKASEYKNLLKSTCKENGKVDHGVNICVLDALALVSVEPPLLSDITNQEGHVGELIEFDVTATDENNNLTAITIDGETPQGATLISTETPGRKIFRWTPDTSVADGEYTVSFKATDETGLKDIKTITIKIVPPESQGTPNIKFKSIMLKTQGRMNDNYVVANTPLEFGFTLTNNGDAPAPETVMNVCLKNEIGVYTETDPEVISGDELAGQPKYDNTCTSISVPELAINQTFDWTNLTSSWTINASSIIGSTNYIDVTLDVLEKITQRSTTPPTPPWRRQYTFQYRPFDPNNLPVPMGPITDAMREQMYKLKLRMDALRQYSSRQEVRPLPTVPPTEEDPAPSDIPRRPIPGRRP